MDEGRKVRREGREGGSGGDREGGREKEGQGRMEGERGGDREIEMRGGRQVGGWGQAGIRGSLHTLYLASSSHLHNIGNFLFNQ